MFTRPLRNRIWERTVDLVFDCFYVCAFFPKKRAALVIAKVKETGTCLTRHIHVDLGLMKARLPQDTPFLMARRLLDELQLQLQIAKGLGFLDSKTFHRLDRQTTRLEKFLHLP